MAVINNQPDYYMNLYAYQPTQSFVEDVSNQTAGTVGELKEKRSLFDANYRKLNIKSDTIGQNVKILRTGVSESLRSIDAVVNDLSTNVLNETRELRDVEKQTARGMQLVGKFETEMGQKMELVKKSITANSDEINRIREDLIEFTKVEKSNAIQEIATTSVQMAENIALAAGVDMASIPFAGLFGGDEAATAATVVSVATDTYSLVMEGKNLKKLGKILGEELTLKDLVPFLGKIITKTTGNDEIEHSLQRYADEKVSKVASLRYRAINQVHLKHVELWVDKLKYQGRDMNFDGALFSSYGQFYIIMSDTVHHLTIDVYMTAKRLTMSVSLDKGITSSDGGRSSVEHKYNFPIANFEKIDIEILPDVEKVYERMSVLESYVKNRNDVNPTLFQDQLYAIIMGEPDNELGIQAEMNDTYESAKLRKMRLANRSLELVADDPEQIHSPLQNAVSATYSERTEHTVRIRPPHGTEKSWILRIVVDEVFKIPGELKVGDLHTEVLDPSTFTAEVHHGEVDLTIKGLKITTYAVPELSSTAHSHPEAHHAQTKMSLFEVGKKFLDSDIGKSVTEVAKSEGRKIITSAIKGLTGQDDHPHDTHTSGNVSWTDRAFSVLKTGLAKFVE